MVTWDLDDEGIGEPPCSIRVEHFGDDVEIEFGMDGHPENGWVLVVGNDDRKKLVEALRREGE
jgi:hypothetical protein